jgi:aminobenzoyl-glutamate transport protein
MPSASAKWAVLAPIFVPMFLLLGYTPEATQVVYRIGDSVANVVTPLNPYLPFLLGVAQKYRQEAGIGTLMALMLPYSLVFTLVWLAQLLVFFFADWPIGPGVGFMLAR